MDARKRATYEDILTLPEHVVGELIDGELHVLFEPELHLGEDVLVPDLAGWRRSTLPRLPVRPGSPRDRTGSVRC